MHLNHLLHAIVDKLPHPSEEHATGMHAAVDLAVEPPPLPDPETTAAEAARAELEELRSQMAAQQARIDELTAPASPTTPEGIADAALALAKKAAPSV